MIVDLLKILIFPGGLFILLAGVMYEWVDYKLLALLQNRVGPRWFQQFADVVKLLAKEEVIPNGANCKLFIGLPIVALAGASFSGWFGRLAALAYAAACRHCFCCDGFGFGRADRLVAYWNCRFGPPDVILGYGVCPRRGSLSVRCLVSGLG